MPKKQPLAVWLGPECRGLCCDTRRRIDDFRNGEFGETAVGIYKEAGGTEFIVVRDEDPTIVGKIREGLEGYGLPRVYPDSVYGDILQYISVYGGWRMLDLDYRLRATICVEGVKPYDWLDGLVHVVILDCDSQLSEEQFIRQKLASATIELRSGSIVDVEIPDGQIAAHPSDNKGDIWSMQIESIPEFNRNRERRNYALKMNVSLCDRKLMRWLTSLFLHKDYHKIVRIHYLSEYA